MYRNNVRITIYVQAISQLDEILEKLSVLTEKHPYTIISIEVGEN